MMYCDPALNDLHHSTPGDSSPSGPHLQSTERLELTGVPGGEG